MPVIGPQQVAFQVGAVIDDARVTVQPQPDHPRQVAAETDKARLKPAVARRGRIGFPLPIVAAVDVGRNSRRVQLGRNAIGHRLVHRLGAVAKIVAQGAHGRLQLVDRVEIGATARHRHPDIFIKAQPRPVIAPARIALVAGGIGLGAAILDQRKIPDLLVAGKDIAAAHQRVAVPAGACQLQGAPVLQPPAQGGGTAPELRPIDRAGDGEIGMGVHVVDAARLIDAIDDADMGIGVIDHGAGADAAGGQRG